MRIVGVVGGILLALSGLVWTLQGLNSTLVPQSFMTGSRTWILIGLVAIVAGCGFAMWSWRRSS